MTIRYKCDECGSVLNIKDELAGTKGHCPKCKVEFTVPSAESAEEGTAVRTRVGEGEQPASGAGGLSDDDIESILGGNGTSSKDGGYGVAAEDDSSDGDGKGKKKSRQLVIEEEEEEPAPRKKKAKDEAPAEPVMSAASLAKELMSKGGKDGSKAEIAELTKKGGKPFGGEEEEDRAYSTTEMAAYLGKQTLPYAVAVIAACVFLYWLSSRMFAKVELPDLGKVSGTVTLNGTPLANATVRFNPMSTDPHKQNLKIASSVGITDKDGKYTLIYIEGVNGAAVGKHLVQISALGANGIEQVPEMYSGKSTLTWDVKAGSNPGVDFQLTIPQTGPSQ